MPRVSASLAWICPTCASSTCGGRTRCVSVRSRPLISLVLSRRRYARYGCRAAAARPRDPARRGPRWPRRDGPDRPRRRGRRPPAPHGAGSRPAARAKSLPSHLTEAASYRSGSWSSIREQITKASSSGGGAGRLPAAEHTPSRLPRSSGQRRRRLSRWTSRPGTSRPGTSRRGLRAAAALRLAQLGLRRARRRVVDQLGVVGRLARHRRQLSELAERVPGFETCGLSAPRVRPPTRARPTPGRRCRAVTGL
jgi:hypothetical protein